MQYIRWMKLFCLLLLNFHTSIDAVEKKDIINQYRITRIPAFSSTIYSLSTDQDLRGYTVAEDGFFSSKHYYSYDHLGIYKGEGIYSLQVGIVDFFADIDIYNEKGKYEGRIEGANLGNRFADFIFYDALGRKIATANLNFNQKDMSCSLLDSSHAILAFLTSTKINNVDVVSYHSEKIPLLFLTTFASFICDERFLEITHWHN